MLNFAKDAMIIVWNRNMKRREKMKREGTFLKEAYVMVNVIIVKVYSMAKTQKLKNQK